MIASWMVKRKVLRNFDLVSQDDFDVNAIMADWTDDAVMDGSSELGVGETVTGKKAIADSFERWKKEFPKRKQIAKNISFAAWPLSLTNVMMVEWSCWERDKQGKEFQYDGATAMHIKNNKVVHASEYISFKGLPQLSALIKPLGKT